MTPDAWLQVKAIVQEALERAPDARAAFVAEACRDDRDLRGQVESLLAAHERAGTSLYAPISPSAAAQIVSELAGSAHKLQRGDRLGPYEVVDALGAGGMGEVYRARDTRLDRTVAIKVLPSRFARDAKLRKRLHREARTISSLNHPHICALYDIGEQDGLEFLVMEYLEGVNLADRLRYGALPLPEVLQYAIEIGRALAEAHRRGVIHRDLKPANVILTATGAKLLDFGIAKLRSDAIAGEASTATGAALTGEGVIVGTPQYMAPEQLEDKPVDAQADIFAFGVVLYEMVTGRKAFEAPSRAALIAAILDHEPPPLSQVQPSAPAALETIVRRCLEKDPTGRYGRVDELVTALTRVAAEAAALGGDAPASAPSFGVTPRQAPAPDEPTRATPAPRAAPSLGVLPFRDLGGGRENEHLGLGLADATITELASVKSLLVRPTAAILRYQDRAADPQQAGRELQVDAVVDGSFQRAGSRLRVTVQLVETVSGRPLWASKIDTTIDDIFRMQDEVSKRIAAALQVELTPEEERRLKRGQGPSGEAYEHYLKGRLHLLRETREEYGIAAGHFEKACSVDPDFVGAWAALADVYSRIAFEYEPAGDWYPKAQQACAKAIALDPTLPEVRYVRGRLLWTPPAGFDHAGALRDMMSALSVRPNLDDAQTLTGIILVHVGLLEESARHLNEAVAINPGNAMGHGWRAGLRFHQGRFEEALDSARAVSAQGIPQDWIEYVIAHSLLRLGRAEEVSRRSEPLVGWGLQSTLGVLAATRGDRAEVERRIGLAIEGRTAFGHFHHTQYDVACIHALLGDCDLALEWLTQAARNGYPCGPFFERDPFLQPLRGMKGFERLLADVAAERQRCLAVYQEARSS